MAPAIGLGIVFVTLNRVYKERKLEVVSVSHFQCRGKEFSSAPLKGNGHISVELWDLWNCSSQTRENIRKMLLFPC